MTFTSALAIAHILAQIPMGGITGGSGAATPWTFIQGKFFDSVGGGTGGSNCANTTSTCAVTVSSVTAGHILIGYGLLSTGTNQISSISGETWTDCASCLLTSNTFAQLDVQYVLSATGGETSFTCTFNSASNGYQACGIIELAHSGTTSFDTGGNATNSSCSTSCSGIGLTLGGTRDAVIQIISPHIDQASSIDSGYTAVCSGASGGGSCSGLGAAYLLNTSSGTAPTWTIGSTEQTSAVAIAISGAAATNPWTFIQSKFWDSFGGTGGSGCGASTTTCTVTASTIGAGHILIVYALMNDTTANGLSSINGETITNCSACQTTNTSFIQASTAYVLSTTGGETSITCTVSDGSGTYIGCGFIELSKTSSATFDTGSVTTSSGCGPSCNGLALTLTGSSDAIFQVMSPHADNASAINSGYTAVCFGTGGSGCDGVGTAYILNTTSGSAPTWTLQSNQQITAFAIAIK